MELGLETVIFTGSKLPGDSYAGKLGSKTGLNIAKELGWNDLQTQLATKAQNVQIIRKKFIFIYVLNLHLYYLIHNLLAMSNTIVESNNNPKHLLEHMSSNHFKIYILKLVELERFNI